LRALWFERQYKHKGRLIALKRHQVKGEDLIVAPNHLLIGALKAFDEIIYFKRWQSFRFEKSFQKVFKKFYTVFFFLTNFPLMNSKTRT